MKVNAFARLQRFVGSFILLFGCIDLAYGVLVLLGPSLAFGLLYMALGVAHVLMGASLRGASASFLDLSDCESSDVTMHFMRGIAHLQRFLVINAVLFVVAMVGLTFVLASTTWVAVHPGHGGIAFLIVASVSVFAFMLIRLTRVRGPRYA